MADSGLSFYSNIERAEGLYSEYLQAKSVSDTGEMGRLLPLIEESLREANLHLSDIPSKGTLRYRTLLTHISEECAQVSRKMADAYNSRNCEKSPVETAEENTLYKILPMPQGSPFNDPNLDLIILSDQEYARIKPLNGISETEFYRTEALYKKIIDGKINLKIKGSEEFTLQIKNDIKILLTRAIGRKLLDQLLHSEAGSMIVIEEGQESRAGSMVENKLVIKISLDDNFKVIGQDALGRRALIRFYPSFIILAHEMIHACHDIKNGGPAIGGPTMGEEYDTLEEQIAITGLKKPMQLKTKSQSHENEEEWDFLTTENTSDYDELNERSISAAFAIDNKSWLPRVGHRGISTGNEEEYFRGLVTQNVLIDLKDVFESHPGHLINLLSSIDRDFIDVIPLSLVDELPPKLLINFLFDFADYVNIKNDDVEGMKNLPQLLKNCDPDFLKRKIDEYNEINLRDKGKFFEQLIFDIFWPSLEEESIKSVFSKSSELKNIFVDKIFASPAIIINYLTSSSYLNINFDSIFEYISSHQNSLDNLSEREQLQLKELVAALPELTPTLMLPDQTDFKSFNEKFKYSSIFEEYIKRGYREVLTQSYEDNPFAMEFFKELIDNPMIIFNDKKFREKGDIVEYLMNFIEMRKGSLLSGTDDPFKSLMKIFFSIPLLYDCVAQGRNLPTTFDKLVKILESILPERDVKNDILNYYVSGYRAQIAKSLVKYVETGS